MENLIVLLYVPLLGLGASGDESAPAWLYAAVGLGAVAFGAFGVSIARRSRSDRWYDQEPRTKKGFKWPWEK